MFISSHFDYLWQTNNDREHGINKFIRASADSDTTIKVVNMNVSYHNLTLCKVFTTSTSIQNQHCDK